MSAHDSALGLSSGSRSSSTLSVGTEGSSDGKQPCLLHNPELTLGSLDQTLEILRRGGRSGTKAQPERFLACDADDKGFELQDVAEWRALSKPSVGFQPTKSFADPRERILPPIALDSEAPHDSLQRAQILFDLQRDRPKVARGGLCAGCACRESCSRDAGSVVIP